MVSLITLNREGINAMRGSKGEKPGQTLLILFSIKNCLLGKTVLLIRYWKIDGNSEKKYEETKFMKIQKLVNP